MAESVDVLVFGAHPDDAEIGAGASILKAAAAGAKVGMFDLSRGEASANGTPEERSHEAREAASFLGASFRHNLALPDGQIGGEGDATIRHLADLIHQHNPRSILVPWKGDSHPDHRATWDLVVKAVFWAKVAVPSRVPPQVFGYFVNGGRDPSLVVDVTDHYQGKLTAVNLHRSQFCRDDGRVPTRLNGPFLAEVAARERYFGSLVGVDYAEGFAVEGPLCARQSPF